MNKEAKVGIIVAAGIAAENKAPVIAEQLRDALPNITLQLNCGGGNFKNQMKRADKSGAQLAIILGEDEIARDEVTIKSLRDDGGQQTLAFVTACQWLKDYLKI